MSWNENKIVFNKAWGFVFYNVAVVKYVLAVLKQSDSDKTNIYLILYVIWNKLEDKIC